MATPADDAIRISLPWRVQGFTKMADTGDYNLNISDGNSDRYFTVKKAEMDSRGIKRISVGDIWTL